jgi:hypothetical protein
MKFSGLCGALLAATLAIGGAKAQEAAVKELISTGKLRFGVAFAPKMSALFVVKDPGDAASGGWGYADFTKGNLAMRRCTKSASPATSLQKIATTSSLTTHLRLELRPTPDSWRHQFLDACKDGCSCSSEGGKKPCPTTPADE